MRILYILPEFPPEFGGGIATVYGQLLSKLQSSGHEITVLLARQDRLDQVSYFWEGVSVVPLQSDYLQQAKEVLSVWRNHTFLYNFLPVAWAAWNQVSAMGAFDIIEVTDWALLFLPWLVNERRQPVVVSLHGSCGQVDWHGNPSCRRGEGQLVRLLEAASLPLADCLVANSRTNCEFWRQQCGVVAQTIPPIFESSPSSIQLSQSKQLQITPGLSRRGLVVGRLQNWKGPEVLCQALRSLPGVQIDWIGQDTSWEESSISTSSHLREKFPDIIDRQLHLLGPRPPHEVRQRILEASFLCIPSLWDVFNVTSLEAITLGTPVICSNQAGASMLFEDQISGYLFDPSSPASLAERLQVMNDFSAPTKDLMARRACSNLSHWVNDAAPISAYLRLYSDLVESFSTPKPSEWLSSFIGHGSDSPTIQNTHAAAKAVKAIRSRCARILKKVEGLFEK
jgi:glycosyltransferase involved in cell wall biosynthesis